jgi:regulator of protease activity HflC (stomatin/prohibitin superfamily)
MSVVTVGIILVCMLLAVVLTLAAASIRILREHQRAVVFRLGRLLGVKGPGLILLIPAIDRMVRVDLRTVTLDVPPQNLITRDNVPARVNAVCYFRVIDAARAVVEVQRYLLATSQIAQTTLRSVLGKADLDMLLSEREQLNEALQHIIDEHTDPWGIKVTTVEIKDVEIPAEMQRAMALGAQAERERRANVIHAEGEFQASRRLRNAADVISGNPASLQLRYLQTLTEIGGQQNSTVIFPLPLDVMKPFVDAAAATAAGAPTALPDTDPRTELPDGALTAEHPGSSGWLARDALESAGLGSRRERAARTHQSSASAAGPLDREGPHACHCARSLDLAGDAPAGARLLRPARGRLGPAGAARRAGAPGGARRGGLPARGAAGRGPRSRHRNRRRSAVARPTVSGGAGHGPGHLGGDDRAGAGEASRRLVVARRVFGRRC